MKRVWAWLRLRLGIFDLLEDFERLRERVSFALQPPPPPPAFVCLLLQGVHGETEEPLTCGQAGYVVSGQELLLELQAEVPMREVIVTVFCDLSRVEVRGVFLGVRYVNACVGSCPTAFFPEWPVGVKVRVPCGYRRLP
jgi:hypothetical protein